MLGVGEMRNEKAAPMRRHLIPLRMDFEDEATYCAIIACAGVREAGGTVSNRMVSF